MWPQMILPPNPIQKNSLHFSNIPNKILPLLHLYTNTILSIRTTPRKPLFLMNSSNLFLSPNSLSSLCHMKLQESTDADRSMLDITFTSKGIEKLLSNLNPHKAAGPDQIKHITLQNLSTPLSPILKFLFQKSLDSGTFPPIWKDAMWRLSTTKVNAVTLQAHIHYLYSL